MGSEFIPANTFSLVLFMAVVAGVLCMVLAGLSSVSRDVLKKGALFLTLWIACLSGVVLSGVLEEHPFPGIPIVFFIINGCAIGMGLSSWGKALSTQLPLWGLVAFQGFRLPLEVVLHLWAEQGTVPREMTWTGQNFDVIAGVLACVALLPFARGRRYAQFFNFVGIGLLLNVIRVAVMTSPLPISWKLDRPLQLAFHMPYALIAFVCVWAAVAGHVVLTRALMAPRGLKAT